MLQILVLYLSTVLLSPSPYSSHFIDYFSRLVWAQVHGSLRERESPNVQAFQHCYTMLNNVLVVKASKRPNSDSRQVGGKYTLPLDEGGVHARTGSICGRFQNLPHSKNLNENLLSSVP